MTRMSGVAWRGLRGWIGPGLVVAAGLALLGYGVLELNRFTRERVQNWGRYTVPFADIDCQPPPGQERADFLAEVQYLAHQPERLPLLDDGLARRLAEAFARHPRVQQVQRVEVVPPRKVRIHLNYRVPVLAVPYEGQTRVVDGRATLLPAGTKAAGLPVFRGKVPPPGQAGTCWRDEDLEAAALTAGYLHAHQDRLQLTRVEAGQGGVVLRTGGKTRVFWGRPPGIEAAGEALAAIKRQRLLQHCSQHGSLDKPAGPYEHDVRPLDQPIRRPLTVQ
jgi:hypothetical protein